MSSEDTLIQIRKTKHQEINNGTYPLPTTIHYRSVATLIELIGHMEVENKIKTSIDLAEVKEGGTYTSSNLRGRVTNLRKSGALTFLKLMDASGSIQLVATKNNLADYDKLRLLDLGDIIEVVGEPVLTKTGERSLLLSSWKVLTKSHRAPPEKWIGITDTELKYRKRYLDLMSSEETRNRFKMRSQIISNIRSFFDSDGFMEVETSTLNSINSGANAKPFTTHHKALDMEMYLRIAPELNLKRLLVGGFEKVYEIGRNYRNEGISTRHNPEFTMLECYQAYASFDSTIRLTEKLLLNLRAFSDKNVSFSLTNFAKISMTNSIVHGMNKLSYVIGDGFDEVMLMANPSEESLSRRKLVDYKFLNKQLKTILSVGERIAFLFEHVAEPFLVEDYRTENDKLSLPVFITEHPWEISPLARANDTNHMVCDRFELFINGMEVANAFQELNDPDEQRLRFEDQLKNNHKDAMDIDNDYIEALEYGMPPACGLGIGIDRLVMLLTNSSSIKDVILFPTLKAVK